MKIKKNIYTLSFALLLFLVLLYYRNYLIYSINNTEKNKEGFLPGMNILLNSQYRNFRFIKENFINTSQEYINRILRKTGIF